MSWICEGCGRYLGGYGHLFDKEGCSMSLWKDQIAKDVAIFTGCDLIVARGAVKSATLTHKAEWGNEDLVFGLAAAKLMLRF